ncbi:hypothetical protein [Saccharothrix coeruleofusca]|uniref:MYXO-CTERM domain-containing protein n=1 Tax=Saccharothrix coeruleofusca TaxID=33919 RepID=A0A918EI75_9PSEU|nr:hypothetical protein [Saccharothrix coeruleofusca]GGP82142.1 hypothetical protein GCM10010185_65330 [Saccharothrix coeruleofusca]
MRRLLAVLATGVVVAGLISATAVGTAQAAECAGVTVVVDRGPLGGGVRTGCAPGDPASGLAALAAAGFGYTFASRQPGYVCRIDGQPAADPCVTPSPTTAYWSYWHGQPGAGWTYSSGGAGGHDPAPGSVEGWAFGAAQPPGIAPPAPAPKPTTTRAGAAEPPAPEPPRPGVPQPATPTTTTGRGGTEDTPRSEPGGETSGDTLSSAPESTPSSAVSTPSSTSPAPGGAPSSTAVPAPVATTSEDRSNGLGWLAGLVVIAVLACLGAWTARRRRAEP